MRSLIFVFLLTCINLQPKSEVKAINLANPFLGGIPQFYPESSIDYLIPHSGPPRMYGNINRWVQPHLLTSLMSDQMNPLSQNKMINPLQQPNMNDMMNLQREQDMYELMNRQRGGGGGGGTVVSGYSWANFEFLVLKFLFCLSFRDSIDSM